MATPSIAVPPETRRGWLLTAAVTAGAFLLRCWHIGWPGTLMFDETAYAKDAYSMYQFGYQGTWTGDTLTPVGSFATHPEVGRWLIGAGEQLFGMNPVGWRAASLVFGTLLVFLVVRLGRQLSGSTLVGAMAGAFVALDGLSFVMSRIAMLDVFQTVFIVAGVSAVVADRSHFRRKLAVLVDGTPGGLAGRPGPFIWRPWLGLAGVLFGLACATKWNAVYPLAVFGVAIVVWSATARHDAGAGRATWWSLVKDGGQALAALVIAGLTYLATWTGWLATSGGYDRQWGAAHPESWVVRHFGTALGSLWQYHVDIYAWQTGPVMASLNHPYATSAWGLPVLLRTIGLYGQTGIEPGTDGCPADAAETCVRVVTGLGTPLLWWAAAVAVIVGLVLWVIRRDQRFSVVVLATCAVWLPWVFTTGHKVFAYYAAPMIPFMAIGLAMLLGRVLTPRSVQGWQALGRARKVVVMAVIVYLLAVAGDFFFNYPIYTGQVLTTAHWMWRMWLPGWI